MDSLYGFSWISPPALYGTRNGRSSSQITGTTPIILVGENWVTNFVNRYPTLSSRFSRRYNYERAKCEDPKIIGEWFNLVQKTII